MLSEGFLETRQWALDYNPARPDDGYVLALEYAQGRYEEMLKLSESMDKKLDDLSRTSLAIGAVIATVARVLGPDSPFPLSSPLTWAVVAFALSVLLAVWSRKPTLFGTPLQVRDLLKVMDDHPALSKGNTEALIAASYHVAVVGTLATNEWKSRQLARATNLLLAGVVLVVVTLITAAPPNPSGPASRGLVSPRRPATGAGAQTRPGNFAAPSRSD